ncbi:MAG: Crp/Fnr family transcriptional regulator [Rhodospirillaceae bacterium]|nr:Crp/Fnr family transcriptional regulator [Rhodospirillaceae bacterium]
MGAIEEKSLDGITLLAGVPAATRRQIEQRCKWRRYTPNEQVIDRHSDSRDVFLIARGRVRVVNYSMSGREVAFDDIDAGGCFGELAAIDGEPRSANVVAVTDSTVAALSPETFTQMLLDHPEIGIRLMRRLARMVRQSTVRIMDLSTLGANNRIHAEILRLAAPTEKSDHSANINPVPLHADIASRVSTTRETVARVLNDLARQGLLQREGDALAICDLRRLRKMVEEFRGE